ncbi:MAG TPA: AMP-binding protein [Amycolatopsis sp.]|uniref:AMP-binding protein n=1 Tax=Amycolatopsis sp. TaxID=37632 RepID=UPI002B4707FF|nr:AMP-binding protein [Amycolatopsis sp.]HKS47441.1 AMP-binding protein [Amycolatopsis sp.]
MTATPLCWKVAGPCDPATLAGRIARAVGSPIPWRVLAPKDGGLAPPAWRLADTAPEESAPVRVVLVAHGPEHHTLLVWESPEAAASGWAERLFELAAPPSATPRHDRYWRTELAGASGCAPPWQRRDHAGGDIAHTRVPLAPGIVARLAADAGVTVADVVAAAAVALQARYGRQRQLLFGSVLGAGFGDGSPGHPARPEVLPVRVSVAAERPFGDFLSEVAAARRRSAVWRPCPVSPSFSVTVAPRRVPRAYRLGEAVITPVPIPRTSANSGLWLDVDGQDVTCWYDSGRAVPDHAERFGRQLAALLREAAARPRQPLTRLRVLEPGERARLLGGANGVAVTYTDQSPVPGRVLRWARRQPAAPAVVSGEFTLSYGELAARAAALAARLTALGVGPDRIVGIQLPRSPDLVVAALAVLVAGGAHLGFDPAEPRKRVERALADAGGTVLITRRWETGDSLRRLTVVDLDSAVRAPTRMKRATVTLSNLCYVDHASGRGVLVPHEGVSNLVSWFGAEFGVAPGDRLLQLASPSAGDWCLEVWPCLGNGATLDIPGDDVSASPERLIGWLRRRRITVAHLPTALAVGPLHRPWPPGSPLRALLVVGGRLDRYPPEGLPFRVFHGYGCAETSVLSACCELKPGERPGGIPPIGRPLPNVRAAVLDESGEPVPPGAVGELHIGGAGVARGYVGRSATRPSPFSADLTAGGRRYATGDLVRLLGDGTLEFVGRADDRIELCGFRIEPGEIEAALRRSVAVRDAAVTAHDGRLVAYVTPRDRARPPDPRQLRRELGDVLPAFMVPRKVVRLDALPLTPHGQVNRRALGHGVRCADLCRPRQIWQPTGQSLV